MNRCLASVTRAANILNDSLRYELYDRLTDLVMSIIPDDVRRNMTQNHIDVRAQIRNMVNNSPFVLTWILAGVESAPVRTPEELATELQEMINTDTENVQAIQDRIGRMVGDFQTLRRQIDERVARPPAGPEPAPRTVRELFQQELDRNVFYRVLVDNRWSWLMVVLVYFSRIVNFVQPVAQPTVGFLADGFEVFFFTLMRAFAFIEPLVRLYLSIRVIRAAALTFVAFGENANLNPQAVDQAIDGNVDAVLQEEPNIDVIQPEEPDILNEPLVPVGRLENARERFETARERMRNFMHRSHDALRRRTVRGRRQANEQQGGKYPDQIHPAQHALSDHFMDMLDTAIIDDAIELMPITKETTVANAAIYMTFFVYKQEDFAGNPPFFEIQTAQAEKANTGESLQSEISQYPEIKGKPGVGHVPASGPAPLFSPPPPGEEVHGGASPAWMKQTIGALAAMTAAVAFMPQ